jgi:hypothetical protein
MIQGSGVPTSTSSLYVLQFCKSRTSTSEYVHRVKVEARADPAGIGLAPAGTGRHCARGVQYVRIQMLPAPSPTEERNGTGSTRT